MTLPIPESIPAEIGQAYFGGRPASAQVLAGGIINTTYLITCGGQKTILQRLSPIFSEGVVEDFVAVTDHLAACGWQVPQIIKTASGQIAVRDAAGQLWRHMTYIEADKTRPDHLDSEGLGAFGALLAQLHADLATLKYRPVFKITHFHDTAYYVRRLNALLPQLPAPNQRALARQVLDAYREAPPLPEVPPQLVHDDPQTSNLLFKNGRPFTIVDFDTVMIGPVWIDIGDAVRSMMEDSLERRARPNPNQLKTFSDGYRQQAALKSSPEHFFEQAVRTGMSLALELAMRFLIDIVEDCYFDWDRSRYTSRGAYNAARAHTQWRIYQQLLSYV